MAVLSSACILITRCRPTSSMYQRSGCLLYEIEQALGRAPLCGGTAERGRPGSGRSFGGSMDATVGRERFWEMFKGRALVVSELPRGRGGARATVATRWAGKNGTWRGRKVKNWGLNDSWVAKVSQPHR